MKDIRENEEQFFREAVQRVHEKELEEYREGAEGESYQPSGAFIENMETLFQKDEKRIRRRNILRAVKASVASAAAVFALLLVLNEDVRAFCLPFLRHHDTVHEMMDYRRTEESAEQDSGEHGKIVGFELGYVPEGFVYQEELSMIEDGVGDLVYENGEEIFLDLAYVRGDTLKVNSEFADRSTVKLDDGTICDYYKSNTKGYASGLVWSRGDVLCNLAIDNGMLGWEEEELFKVANGIRTKYEDGTIE